MPGRVLGAAVPQGGAGRGQAPWSPSPKTELSLVVNLDEGLLCYSFHSLYRPDPVPGTVMGTRDRRAGGTHSKSWKQTRSHRYNPGGEVSEIQARAPGSSQGPGPGRPPVEEAPELSVEGVSVSQEPWTGVTPAYTWDRHGAPQQPCVPLSRPGGTQGSPGAGTSPGECGMSPCRSIGPTWSQPFCQAAEAAGPTHGQTGGEGLEPLSRGQ